MLAFMHTVFILGLFKDVLHGSNIRMYTFFKNKIYYFKIKLLVYGQNPNISNNGNYIKKSTEKPLLCCTILKKIYGY